VFLTYTQIFTLYSILFCSFIEQTVHFSGHHGMVWNYCHAAGG